MKTKAKPYKWTDKQIDLMISLRNTHTMKEAAKVVGCSENNIRSKARALNVSFRKYGENHFSGKHSNEDVRLVKLLLEEGLTQKVIAEKMEMTQPEVSMIKNGKYRVHG